MNDEITRAIIGCSMDLIREIGTGYLESVYQKCLCILIKEKGLHVECEVPLKIYFREQCVGEFKADLLIENQVIVELKVSRSLASEHSAQVIHYLNLSKKEVGLLINFGNPKLEFKRLTRSYSEFKRSYAS